MADYYFDSSAMVKCYAAEAGSNWVTAILADTSHRLFIARIAGAEVMGTIARRSRAGSLPNARKAVQDFQADYASRYRPLEVDLLLIAEAMRLAEKHALRGYDAVHLASALDTRLNWAADPTSFTLVSADKELNVAALAEGLLVEDPNNHP